jgi:pyruvate dehydrogenase E2 component (dihydrolipoamide acetyltransferase)
MPIEIPMPKLGLTMEEGTVVEWLKAPGDAVAKGEPLFVLETDKLTLEAEAHESGILDQILVPAGATVPTGTPVGLLRQAEEEAAAPSTPREAPAGKPKIKATPVARRLAKQKGLDVGRIRGTGPGGRVTAQDVEEALAEANESTKDTAVQRAAAREPGAPPLPEQPQRRVKASPRARERAAAAGLDLATVEGMGREGRVMVRDVEQALATAGAKEPGEARASQALVGPAGQVVPLSGVRGVIARRMSASAHTAAAVTTTTQADATELARLRDALRQEWASSMGLAPTYNDLLIVILGKALGEFPYMNAHLVEGKIHQVENIHIGLAVDTGQGLIVPVIRSVQDLLLADVTRATGDLVQRAREGKLLPDDLEGGTFTLSNLGAFDVEASTPIINLPECAILGVGRIAPRPAVFDGELCVRQTVTLSLSYDHRAIDGAPASRFLERVKHLVEQPHLALVR